jgi:hypothetical protein
MILFSGQVIMPLYAFTSTTGGPLETTVGKLKVGLARPVHGELFDLNTKLACEALEVMQRVPGSARGRVPDDLFDQTRPGVGKGRVS